MGVVPITAQAFPFTAQDQERRPPGKTTEAKEIQGAIERDRRPGPTRAGGTGGSCAPKAQVWALPSHFPQGTRTSSRSASSGRGERGLLPHQALPLTLPPLSTQGGPPSGLSTCPTPAPRAQLRGAGPGPLPRPRSTRIPGSLRPCARPAWTQALQTDGVHHPDHPQTCRGPRATAQDVWRPLSSWHTRPGHGLPPLHAHGLHEAAREGDQPRGAQGKASRCSRKSSGGTVPPPLPATSAKPSGFGALHPRRQEHRAGPPRRPGPGGLKVPVGTPLRTERPVSPHRATYGPAVHAGGREPAPGGPPDAVQRSSQVRSPGHTRYHGGARVPSGPAGRPLLGLLHGGAWVVGRQARLPSRGGAPQGEPLLLRGRRGSEQPALPPAPTTSMSCAMDSPKWTRTTSEMLATGRDHLL